MALKNSAEEHQSNMGIDVPYLKEFFYNQLVRQTQRPIILVRNTEIHMQRYITERFKHIRSFHERHFISKKIYKQLNKKTNPLQHFSKETSYLST